MAGRTTIKEAVVAEIAHLPDLGLDELRARWRELYGSPAPKTLRRKLLILSIAYRLQVDAFGGLSKSTERRLRQVAEASRVGRRIDFNYFSAKFTYLTLYLRSVSIR